MHRFVLLTRGRTGSTAIADELDSHPAITCHQELLRLADPRSARAFERYGAACFDEPLRGELGLQDSVVPFALYSRIRDRPASLADYFDYLAQEAGVRGSRWSGCKLLLHALDEWAELEPLEYFARENFRILLLMRRDEVREALSGLVAAARDLYFVDRTERDFAEKSRRLDDPVRIAPCQVIEQVEYIRFHREGTRERLREHGLQTLELAYEDFVVRREIFFSRICDFFDLETVSLERTRFRQVMPQDLSRIIENHDELVCDLERAGLRLAAGPEPGPHHDPSA